MISDVALYNNLAAVNLQAMHQLTDHHSQPSSLIVICQSWGGLVLAGLQQLLVTIVKKSPTHQHSLMPLCMTDSLKNMHDSGAGPCYEYI